MEKIDKRGQNGEYPPHNFMLNCGCFVPIQSDSEGSNSSLDLGNGVASMALTTVEGSPNTGAVVKCR